jgi:UDP-2-acetamido-3-amino-2,3-dideoxy-glucuronate N-acetyltransferase
MSEMNRKVAVVGSGFWGKNLVRNYHSLGTLRWICDAEPRTLDVFRAQYHDIEITTRFEDVLSDPAVAGVAVAVPTGLHYEFATRALEAGKDVYVEKPLALDLGHARQMIATAERRDRILMVGHLLQYHPAFVRLKELSEQGELGRVQYIYSNRLSLGQIRREENALWSFAPHDISMILSLAKETPDEIVAVGGNYLHASIADVTTTHLSFPSGIKAHIFVSWLHPFKEHKLIVVADKKMAVFEDTQPWARKLALYPHSIKWKKGAPVPERGEVEYVAVPEEEPLTLECRTFLDCITTRRKPLTDGEEGYRVLEVLDHAQRSLKGVGSASSSTNEVKAYFAHATAAVDMPCEIGPDTKIWHFSHVMKGARIGSGCVLGQNVNVASEAVLGNNVKVQNNVSIYDGVTVEDDVFLGPSCVFTNVTNPRSEVNRHSLYEKTLIQRGATVGANATVVCGVTLGRFSFVAAGAVVTNDAPDYALVAGVPARRIGWMSRHGHRLVKADRYGVFVCPESGLRYKEVGPDSLRCLDLDEDAPLRNRVRKESVGHNETKRKTAGRRGRR